MRHSYSRRLLLGMAFLSDEELFQLTKRVQVVARIRELRRQGIAFNVDADGRPWSLGII